MTDLLQNAWLLAAEYHEGQRYYTPKEGVTLSYLTHLGAVMLEAQEALRRDSTLDGKLLLLCAILHDSLEDTNLSSDLLRDQFGEAVLAGVQALTKNEALPTKRAQMEDSLRRIRQQPREVAAVKLCDRINNLSPPPHHWTGAKRLAYREEAQLILDTLGYADRYLAERLKAKIADYPI
ncbi:MAG: HD domain-containing protein [Bacteroidota bacterium]